MLCIRGLEQENVFLLIVFLKPFQEGLTINKCSVKNVFINHLKHCMYFLTIRPKCVTVLHAIDGIGDQEQCLIIIMYILLQHIVQVQFPLLTA